ncbi:glycosyltransferase family 9 protein [Chitinophaga oryzae]|uniref:Glycosyltransferase family 9 protein n=1 Tax=Chitinophaga oryzae TaxID=2725414 RepID=A0AAE6ZBT9_9BACT|nr:glycosyltransferase family 9 protein [Chitinophaga oryzae]QJB30078.1 glycosyltransferase family 9 protein [Chitinophaga oryzae]QJB36575.1 glycosyltransferase family 9 protein [Chitinophaga oryzae]
MHYPWNECKKILCIRLDNMGDLLMSAPAFRALKEAGRCQLSVLTSAAAAPAAALLPEIDNVFVFNAPWVKQDHVTTPDTYQELVAMLAHEHFDAAIIFTVFSQSPLPAALMAMQAGIPLRLAYCRENPYQLLTHWMPDKEPFETPLHQVERDLQLVRYMGAPVIDSRLSIQTDETLWPGIVRKLAVHKADPHKPWMLLHPMVQDAKRQFSFVKWVEIGREIIRQHDCQLLITGNSGEEADAARLQQAIGDHRAINMAGAFSLREFALLVRRSPLIISVNTGTIHIAAATSTPVIVLYAMTNLQHTPWHGRGTVLYFDVPEKQQSRNTLLTWHYQQIKKKQLPMATVENVLHAVNKALQLV